MKHNIIRLIAGMAFSLAANPAAPLKAAPENGVYIVGALHGLHEKEPAFDYAALHALIRRIDPDVLVLEVRPDELAGFKDTPGRPEYPVIIWPILAQGGPDAVAMEPGGALFEAMVGRGKAAFDTFRARDPLRAERLGAMDDAFEQVMTEYWQTVADTQGDTTALVAEAFALTRTQLVGPDFESLQSEWDGHMISVAADTIERNPGKRVLVLCSYRNRATLEAGLLAAAAGRLVSPAAWPPLASSGE